MMMQQAYRALRIVAEAQTIRMVLATHPGDLMLKELSSACATLGAQGSSGVKAVVLDFSAGVGSTHAEPAGVLVEKTRTAIGSVPQPVLAVVRSTLSAAACTLMQAADLTLAAHDANLILPGTVFSNDTFPGKQATLTNMVSNDILPGKQAALMGYITWSVPAQQIDRETERILNMLREKSAIALRHAKASVRLAQADHATPLEALKQVNTFYLSELMRTTDAREGLQAFLEKRKPRWKNS